MSSQHRPEGGFVAQHLEKAQDQPKSPEEGDICAEMIFGHLCGLNEP